MATSIEGRTLQVMGVGRQMKERRERENEMKGGVGDGKETGGEQADKPKPMDDWPPSGDQSM